MPSRHHTKSGLKGHFNHAGPGPTFLLFSLSIFVHYLNTLEVKKKWTKCLLLGGEKNNYIYTHTYIKPPSLKTIHSLWTFDLFEDEPINWHVRVLQWFFFPSKLCLLINQWQTLKIMFSTCKGTRYVLLINSSCKRNFRSWIWILKLTNIGVICNVTMIKKNIFTSGRELFSHYQWNFVTHVMHSEGGYSC